MKIKNITYSFIINRIKVVLILFLISSIKLRAQNFIPELQSDTTLKGLAVYNGTEISGNKYTFLFSSKIDTKHYGIFVCTVNLSGKILLKNKIQFHFDSSVQVLNIHYTNPGYIISGTINILDTVTYKALGSYMCVYRLDDNLNVLSFNYKYIDTLFYTANNGTSFKSRLLNNKIVAVGSSDNGELCSIIDTTGKILLFKFPEPTQIFDITTYQNGYIGVRGLLSNHSFDYLNDSMHFVGKSFDWPQDCAIHDMGCIFNKQGLSDNMADPSFKKLSSVSLLHGSDCDSMFDWNDPKVAGQSKQMFAFIKTDYSGHIIRKIGITPAGWSNFSLQPDVTNCFDFVDPNNIFLGVNAGRGFFIVNVDSNLNERWRKMVYHPNPDVIVKYCYSMFATSDGGCILMGIANNRFDTPSYNATAISFIVKINAKGNVNGILNSDLFDQDFLVYPNPANDKIIIDLLKSQKATVEIINLTGQIISTQNINNKENTIRIDELSNGIYFLKITSENNFYSTRKIIVNH